MCCGVNPRRALLLAACAATLLALPACNRHTPIDAKVFVGKWRSSRLATPLYLYANGEWEIRQDDGTVLQYGVWEYKDHHLLWSYKLGKQFGHDTTTVLAASPQEIRLQESDNSTTIFTKLGPVTH
ncbi:MAG: hypothetical protein NTZ15_08480 [Burkholderiales bacterium]|nr:hypothetical protein [Burkholderiales bacterium]